ncbi:MAG: ABC transporter ATP-binding protein [Solirubrobacteraceae bacterium]
MSALELREVVKGYPSGRGVVRAVDGVSLTVAPGEFVALYGPSGSGKTTLLMLTVGLLAPDGGTIRFGGIDIGGLSERECARYRLNEVGFIFQSFHLASGATALDNVTTKLIGAGLSLRDARRRARPWLDRMGLGDRAEHMPSQLSMGERQRVAIARALVNRPKLLLADEPTGNLDSKRTRDVLGLLRAICHEQGIPGLLVTHDVEAIGFVDRVYSLRDGRLTPGLDNELAAVSV